MNTIPSKVDCYEAINKAETAEELKAAIIFAASGSEIIFGRTKTFKTQQQVDSVDGVIFGTLTANNLTREFGIRQQALYIKHYTPKSLQV